MRVNAAWRFREHVSKSARRVSLAAQLQLVPVGRGDQLLGVAEGSLRQGTVRQVAAALRRLCAAQPTGGAHLLHLHQKRHGLSEAASEHVQPLPVHNCNMFFSGCSSPAACTVQRAAR